MAAVPVSHIEIAEGKFGQRAYVGKRMAVELVAYAYLNGGSIEWISENFGLTHAQIHAALSYYYDNQEDLDRQVQEGMKLAQQLGSEV